VSKGNTKASTIIRFIAQAQMRQAKELAQWKANELASMREGEAQEVERFLGLLSEGVRAALGEVTADERDHQGQMIWIRFTVEGHPVEMYRDQEYWYPSMGGFSTGGLDGDANFEYRFLIGLGEMLQHVQDKEAREAAREGA
jgi:hypothetical protein